MFDGQPNSGRTGIPFRKFVGVLEGCNIQAHIDPFYLIILHCTLQERQMSRASMKKAFTLHFIGSIQTQQAYWGGYVTAELSRM